MVYLTHMKRVVNTAGFTIVETMIVLAVTGLLFTVAANSWNGKQHANEYQAATQDVRSRLQQTVSDVENGYFPVATDLDCSVVGAVLRFGATDAEQGSNVGCVFLGKAVQFSVGDSQPETLNQYSVAGINRTDSSDIQLSRPTLAPGLTEVLRLMPDLTTERVRALHDGGTNYRGIAFLSDVGSYNDGGALQSGTQAIRLYALQGSLGSSDQLLITSNRTSGYPLTAARLEAAPEGVEICFRSGGTDNFAIITVGGKGAAGDVQATSRKGDCG